MAEAKRGKTRMSPATNVREMLKHNTICLDSALKENKIGWN